MDSTLSEKQLFTLSEKQLKGQIMSSAFNFQWYEQWNGVQEMLNWDFSQIRCVLKNILTFQSAILTFSIAQIESFMI